MISPNEFMKYWNSKPTLLPMRAWSGKRMIALRAKCNNPEFVKHWKYIIDMAASLPFYQGQNDRGWKANVDWMLIRQDGWLKLLEKYPPETIKPVTRPIQTLTPRERALQEMK